MTKDKLRDALREALRGWQVALNAHEDGKSEGIEQSRDRLREACDRAGITFQERPPKVQTRGTGTPSYTPPRARDEQAAESEANQSEGRRQE